MQVDDWVIVGGGIHGVCAARALSERGASLSIFEPSGQLLDRWAVRAKAVAMTRMRSPASHHLDAAPVSLHHFVHRAENADVAQLAGTFRRPTYEAFDRHSREVIAAQGLDELVVPARVDSIRAEGQHLLVEGGGHLRRAARVLVATGSNVPCIPAWARQLQREGAPIHHVLDEGARLVNDLVGGGISAVQRALMVRRATKQPVRLWLRHPLRVREFDFDRLWAKHRFMGRWSSLGEPERCDFLDRHPQQGSVPPKLAERLNRAVRRGQIELEHGVPTVEWDSSQGQLLLRGEGRTVEASGLTLATGFMPETTPGWLRPTVEQLALSSVRGLPRLDREMHWGRGLYLSGPLARLRLGPMASHIVGARWATSLLPGARLQPV